MTFFNKLKVKDSKLIINNSKLNLHSYPWYLAGGINISNCIAAYQPKGAANLSASYINLANPGTYDCEVVPSGNYDYIAPVFSSDSGWTFTNNGSEPWNRLKTGLNTAVLGKGTGSIVACLKSADVINSGNSYILAGYCFAEDWENGNMIALEATNASIAYYNGDWFSVSPILFPPGVVDKAYWGLLGTNCYFNDSLVTTAPVWNDLGGTSIDDIYIGCVYGSNDESNNGWSGELYALAFYNKILTLAEYQAVKTTMEAL